jgi:hypothetical protein
MQFSPAWRYSLLPRSKSFSQHSVFKHPRNLSLPWCNWSTFTSRRNYTSGTLRFIVSDRIWENEKKGLETPTEFTLLICFTNVVLNSHCSSQVLEFLRNLLDVFTLGLCSALWGRGTTAYFTFFLFTSTAKICQQHLINLCGTHVTTSEFREIPLK